MTRPKHVRSSAKQKRAGLKKATSHVDKNLSTYAKNKLAKVLKKYAKGKDTKEKYTNKTTGKYTVKRRKLHKKIIRKYMKVNTKDNPNDKPDLYMMGGTPGSQKTTSVKHYIKEKALVINNDDIKAELAKRHKSPIKKYPLIHATLLHEEASDVEEKVIAKARQQKKDVILDRTMKNYNKNKAEVNKFRKAGYRVSVYGSNLQPHRAVFRAAHRFTSAGRYVPLGMITRYGNQTNQNVVRMANKPYVKDAVVVDTKAITPDNPNAKVKIVYRKKNYKRLSD